MRNIAIAVFSLVLIGWAAQVANAIEYYEYTTSDGVSSFTDSADEVPPAYTAEKKNTADIDYMHTVVTDTAVLHKWVDVPTLPQIQELQTKSNIVIRKERRQEGQYNREVWVVYVDGKEWMITPSLRPLFIPR